MPLNKKPNPHFHFERDIDQNPEIEASLILFNDNFLIFFLIEFYFYVYKYLEIS